MVQSKYVIPELEVYLKGFKDYSATKIRGGNVSKVIEAYNVWLNIPEDKLKIIHQVAEMCNLYGVILDDIIRGDRPLFPTDDLKDALPSTLSASLYTDVMVLAKVRLLNVTEATEVYIKEWGIICIALAEEIHWRDTLKYPSESEFRKVTARGNEMQFMYKLMGLSSDNKKTDLNKITKLLQEFLQIYNDYCNYYSEDYTFLETAKFNFPMIQAIQSENLENPIINILRTGIKNDSTAKYVINLIDSVGCLKYTKGLLIQLIDAIKEEAAKLPKNASLEKFLNQAALTIRNSKLKVDASDNVKITV